MPDLLAGTTILAQDFLAPVEAIVTDSFDDLVTTGYEPTDPACETLFSAPTSGRVEFIIMVRTDADVDDERYNADVEVRVGSDAGVVVHAPDINDGQGISHTWPVEAAAFDNQIGYRKLTGLTPGGAYHAQLQIATSGIDVSEQRIVIKSLP